MKKKKILFFLAFYMCLFGFSQTKAERKKITESYDKDYINDLKKEIYTSFLERENKINNYFKSNKTSKKNYKVKGRLYEVFDIIDGKPVYITTHNVNSAKATKTDKLQTGGSLGLNLDGQNMIIGVWDQESVLASHPEFKDDNPVIPKTRVVYPEFPNGILIGTVSDHATHVAGTLAGKGDDPDARGMAPKAALRSFDWSSDDAEALDEAANGLLVSNHSYGVPIFNNGTQQVSSANIGSYSIDARTWDEVAFAAPYYLAVNSAGNEGDDDYTGGLATGYDKLTGNKTAKNNLVVANANPFIVQATGVLIDFPINSSSSQGPTDDFRVKPDITGDGTAVLSSVSTVPTRTNPPPPRPGEPYDSYSGTSMASPNVAGSLILLQQYYNQLNSSYMRAATIKGLVCHTAKDDVSRIGPDPIYGWGLLDAEVSTNTIKDDSNGAAVIKELSLTNGTTYTYLFTATLGSPLKATICWTDPAGTLSSSPSNVLTPRLVNDLDLRLEDSNSTEFTPWKLDNMNVAGAAAIKGDNTVDNIERIDINSPVAGNFTLTVTHKSTLVNGSQAFSLIVTGANLVLNNTEKSFQNVLVWPNPVNDRLNISFKPIKNKTQINLYNLLGKEIYQVNLNTDTFKVDYTMDTKKFAKGIYFLKIKNGNLVYNKKIIIK